MQIRPVSDLRNKFTDIEKVVQSGGSVYLTKMIEPEEYIMDVADASAASTDLRFTHDEVFGSIREKVNV